MQRGLFHQLIIALLIVLASAPALAQFTRDKAANKKIDEAINKHYFATDFDRAEGILLGTLKACEDKCSPQAKARAWMYVGIVRGSGRQDIAGAQKAFATAVALDPSVQLDADIASAETQQAFIDAGGSAAGGTPPSQPIDTGPAAPGQPAPATPTVAGEMQCTPAGRELQTRRPMPVSCMSAQDVAIAELRYKELGSESWVSVPMRQTGEYWQAEVPCQATMDAGALRWYVQAKDGTGATVDNYGSQGQPVMVTITNESVAQPPAFPGVPPPERCVAEEECPPDFPGCDSGDDKCGDKDWGSSCENSTECKCGLLCIDGSCETAPVCESDIDCPVGSCVGGTCSVDYDDEGSGPSGPFKRHWVGVHFGVDFMVAEGADVCYSGAQATGKFACYSRNRPPPTGETPPDPEPYPYRTNSAGVREEAYFGKGIAGGLALGTMRAMLSYDFALARIVTVGVRAGYAFGGAPELLPVHGELRGTFYLLDLGSTLAPYIGLGGGVAEVNAKFQTTVRNCDPNAPPPYNHTQCVNADSDNPYPGADSLERIDVDVYQKAGLFFGGAHLGALIHLGPIAAQLNVNAMAIGLGSETFAFNLEPSLGVVLGF